MKAKSGFKYPQYLFFVLSLRLSNKIGNYMRKTLPDKFQSWRKDIFKTGHPLEVFASAITYPASSEETVCESRVPEWWLFLIHKQHFKTLLGMVSFLCHRLGVYFRTSSFWRTWLALQKKLGMIFLCLISWEIESLQIMNIICKPC